MKTLTISRKKWLTPNAKKRWGKLYHGSNRKMCCLGFLARECGAKVKDILNQNMPCDVPDVEWPKEIAPTIDDHGLPLDAELARELAAINDNPDISNKEREKLIRDKFATIGWRVKFVP